MVANPTLRWSIEADNLIDNGSFETALVQPWVAAPDAITGWRLQQLGGGAYDGQWVATQIPVSRPDICELHQDLTLPADSDHVTLFWADRVSRYSGTRDPKVFLRVELRDPSNRLLSELAEIRPEPNQIEAWQLRSADLTPWRGRSVRLVFVAGKASLGTWSAQLDAVRVVAGRTNGTVFHVFVGATTNLGPSDLRGQTEHPAWPLERMPPQSKVYWRVDTQTATTNEVGPTWGFTVGPTGALHHLAVTPSPAPRLAGQPFTLTCSAEDVFQHLVPGFQGAVEVAAYAHAARSPRIVITEVAGRAQDGIEFLNASTARVNLSGWQVLGYSGSTATGPAFTFTLPDSTFIDPGGLWVLRQPGATSPPPALDFISPAVQWTVTSGISVSVVLLDSDSNIVDFVTLGSRQATNILSPFTIPNSEWRSASVAGGSASQPWSRQRRGGVDNNRADDWVQGTPNLGVVNPDLALPFEPGFGVVSLALQIPASLTNGIGVCGVTASITCSNAFVEVRAPGALPSRSALFDIQDQPYVYLLTQSVREGDGTVADALTLRLQAPRAVDTPLHLTMAPEGQAILSPTITIPAGRLEASSAVTPIDDDLLDGPQAVWISGTAAGLRVIPGSLQVRDNETARLTLSAPAELIEGQAGITRVFSSRPPDRDVTVAITVSPQYRFGPIPPLLLRAGTTEVAFSLQSLDDNWVDGDLIAGLQAAVDHWTIGDASIALRDDEPTQLRLSLPATVTENAGTLTHVAQLALPGRTRLARDVALSAAPANRMLIPDHVTVGAGMSNVAFSLQILDNPDREGTVPVTVTATAAGFEAGQTTLAIGDDDPADFVLSPVPSPQWVGVPIQVAVAAYDAQGQLLQAGPLDAVARLERAGIPGEATSLTITNGQGQWVGVPIDPGTDVRLVVEGRGARGESSRFNVLQTLSGTVEGPVRDVAWIPPAGPLLAAIPQGAAAHAGEIVTVNPTDGTLATWATVPGGIGSGGPSSGRMAVTPDGTRLFLAAADGNMVQGWDTGTRTLTQVATLANGSRVADLTVVRANPWRLVVAAVRPDGMVDSATMLNESFGATVVFPPRWLRSTVADPTFPETAYVFYPYRIAEWKTGPAGVLTERALREGPYYDAFLPMTAMAGRLFAADGSGADIRSGTPLGPLRTPASARDSPWTALMAADTEVQEVLLASPEGEGLTRVQSFGAMDLLLRRDQLVPGSLNTPRRMLRIGANRLALVAGDALRFVRWPATPRDGDLADLALAATPASPTPRIGDDWVWSVMVTNRGPAAASDLQFRISLPPDMTLVEASLPGGRTWVEDAVVRGHVLETPAGQTAVLSLTLRPVRGGWTTNQFTVIANETDADSLNNSLELATFIRPTGNPDAIDILRLNVRDLVYDPLHAMLYAVERTRPGASQTTLLRLNAETMTPETFRTLPGHASKTSLSADSRWLYLAIEDGRSARRIDLSGAEPDTDFTLFAPEPDAEFVFHDLAVDPTDPRRLLAVATMRRPARLDYETTIAAFREGLRLPADVRRPRDGSTVYAHLKFDPGLSSASVAREDGLVVRLQSTADGVQAMTQYGAFEVAIGFLSAGGLLYTRAGTELVADTGQVLRKLPSSLGEGGVIAYDPSTDRILLLQQAHGSWGAVWPLQAFDRLTLAPTVTLDVTSTGRPDALVVLAADRLVATTDAGELLVISSRALSEPTAADLAVRLEIQPRQPVAGEPVTVSVILTNRGPSTALAPSVTCELPAYFARDTVQPPLPPGSVYGLYPIPMLWTNAALPPGGSLSFVLRGQFTAAAAMRLAAGAGDRTLDPDPGNHYAELVVPVPYHLEAGQAARLGLHVLDAVYDAARNRILVTTGSGRDLSRLLVAIDAETGLPTASLDVGPDPSLLAISDDHQVLYVATETGQRVTRVNLETFQSSLKFPAEPLGALLGPTFSFRGFTVNPGAPGELAVAQPDGTVTLWVDGVRQPETAPWGGGELLFYAPDRLVSARRTFPIVLQRLRITGNGLTLEAEGGPTQLDAFRVGGGLLIGFDGRTVDPDQLRQVGQFPWVGPVAIDASRRTVFAGSNATGLSLWAFDLDSQARLGSEPMAVPFSGSPLDLFLAGGNRVALRLNSGELVVMASTAVPAQPLADLAVQLMATTDWRVGTPCEWAVTITNRGPHPAPGARLDLRLPEGMTFFRATGPAQPVSTFDPQVSLTLGTLPAGHAATLRLTAVAQTPALAAELLASARSEAVDEPRSNNIDRLVRPIELSRAENRVDSLPVAATDLAYDPVTGTLCVASAALDAGVTNQLLAIDPARGLLKAQTTLPGRPSRVAVSSGGEYVYVALDGSERIACYRLPSLALDHQFTTVSNTVLPWCDLLVRPGEPTQVLVSRMGGTDPTGSGVRLFDNTLARPQWLVDASPLAFGLHPDQLIVVDSTTGEYRLRFATITAEGLTLEDTVGDPLGGYMDFRSGGPILLSFAGQILDRGTLRQRGTLPLPFLTQAFALSAEGRRAVLAAGSNRTVGTVEFVGFDTDTRQPTGMTRTGTTPLEVQRLVLWGTDGVAALADQRLLIGRLDLANPSLADTDADGMPDPWETAHDLDARTPDAAADPDNDGASNWQEYLSGTHPRLVTSVPRLEPSVLGPPTLRLAFSCAAGRTFTLEATADLTSPAWFPLWESTSQGGLQVFETDMRSESPNFFRVRIQP